MSKARDFKFSAQIDRQAYETKQNAKVGQKVRALRHMSYLYDLGLLYISGMGKARDFKFCAQIDRQAYKPKSAKSRPSSMEACPT